MADFAEQLTAALRTSARVRAERALVTKQKSLGNGTRNVLDAANAMQLKNPHVAVVMRASHVLSGFTVVSETLPILFHIGHEVAAIPF